MSFRSLTKTSQIETRDRTIESLQSILEKERGRWGSERLELQQRLSSASAAEASSSRSLESSRDEVGEGSFAHA